MSRSRLPGPPLLVTLLLLLAPLAARADEGATREVRSALAGIETGPDMDRLRAIPGAERALRETAADARLPTTTRARAVIALGEFRSVDTRLYLERLVASEATSESLRTRAALALARSAGAEAVPALRTALAAGNPYVRAACVTALAGLQAPEAAKLIERRRGVERDAVVLEALQAVPPR